jgi:hypothetical protein
MKKTIFSASIIFLLAATPGMAQQMMGSGQMMGGQETAAGQQMTGQEQAAPNLMYPGMMRGYGYGMGPGMMGGYGGYGMGPGMMGGYGGYGMGPGMMGGYGGYGMGPGMMGGYGYGMGPGMMGGYGCGMGPGMMGYYSPDEYKKQFNKNQAFLDATKDLRKKLHSLRFDYAEAVRNPATKQEDLIKMNEEMESILKQIYEKGNPNN